MQMVKRLFSVFLLAILSVLHVSFAGDRAKEYEVKIIEKLLLDATKSRRVHVYILAPQKEQRELTEEIILHSRKLIIVRSPKKADFILVKDLKKEIKLPKPALALDFESIENCPMCIGVFAWKNGRPMLLLYRKRLNMFNIKLPKDYDYFIEEDVNY